MSSAVATSAGDQDAPRPARRDTPHAVVRAANLPAPLVDLVLAVTGKCRLWNSERTDVARELCAHFRDGLEAGVSPDELAGSFGDPAHAANLITATRRRMRPLWWRSARTTARATAALGLVLVLLYAVLAARFFLVRPTIGRNIMAELNAAVRATPAPDRAWPLYIEAKKGFGPEPEFMISASVQAPEHPGDANWDKLAAYLQEHADNLETLRTAASKPIVGYTYRSTIDPDLAQAMTITNPGYTPDPVEPEPANPPVIGILLPHLGEMRRGARWLRADAELAVSTRDRARFIADIDAIMGIGDQSFREKFAISQLVGIAVCEVGVSQVMEHAATPGLLTDDDLRHLAHRLAAFGGNSMSLDVSAEMLGVEDILQRFFSDDGHGDGRFVGGGNEAERLRTDFGVARPKSMFMTRAYQPLQSVVLPSRAALMERARRVAAAAAVDDALPPWRHDERTADALNLELMQSGIFAIMPYLESLYGGPDGLGVYANTFGTRDIVRARRDAALAVLAMESYRRANGAWPTTLAELVPNYLPSVPLDPFDGKPLRYLPPTSESGSPVLYSIGVDGKDDGGRLTTTAAGRFGVHNLAWQAKFRSRQAMTPELQTAMDAVRGDWVLWPVPAPLKKDDK